MADDRDDAQKTEEATPKRHEDAHKKGQVAKSQEVSHWFMTFGIALAVLVFSIGVGSGVTNRLVPFIERPEQILIGGGNLTTLIGGLGRDVIVILLPPLGILMLAAILGNVVQHRPVFSVERLKPKLNKISPLAGIKRQFSLRAVLDFAKGLLKLFLVAAVALYIVWPELGKLPDLARSDVGMLLPLVRELALKMLAGVVAVMAFIAGFDFLYQKYAHAKQLRMTKQEVKDEYKQLEGDPLIKQRLRQLRMERSRQRMMTAVPNATVVVTNPTHFAVALHYEQQGDEAPVVVAKGQDLIARKIRELATEHDVPIVENKPLARALYASVEIDQEIPYEHYKAVAEIIGYVMRLRGKSVAQHR
jgi:flagellar biosynthetic protein FlhB